MLQKGQTADGSVGVVFVHPVSDGTSSIAVVGDFNDWDPEAHPMTIGADEASCEIPLAPGRAYRFRYLVDGARWENDWRADAYVPNDYGGDDSVVDLTDVTIDLTDGSAAPDQEPTPEPAPTQEPPPKAKRTRKTTTPKAKG